MVSERVRHKQTCTSTEDGQRLEILDLESRGDQSNSTFQLAKTKALICADVSDLGFVLAHAECWYSHDAALSFSCALQFQYL